MGKGLCTISDLYRSKDRWNNSPPSFPNLLAQELTPNRFQYQNELGIKPTDLSNTFVDMAYSMIDGGFIKKTSKYKGRPETPV